MKEIGGYFELELSRGKEYHNKAIKLNSARNGLKYILEAQKITKVYLPAYICDSVIEPCIELGVDYEFYNIDENFEIIQNIQLGKKEKILAVNYYGLKAHYIQKLALRYKDRLIVDNTQAFFEMPIKGIDTIYSPRKFFVVSDGGYLYTDIMLERNLEQAVSNHTEHLIGRITNNASAFYVKYSKAESSLLKQSIQIMSSFTQQILASIDYDNAMKRRKENFDYLHEKLKVYNSLPVDNFEVNIPFSYPLMIKDASLRKKLIDDKIYTPKYWEDALNRILSSDTEHSFIENIIPLPIDQRYEIEDMNFIINSINKGLHNE